jgi:hypothetical protein
MTIPILIDLFSYLTRNTEISKNNPFATYLGENTEVDVPELFPALMSAILESHACFNETGSLKEPDLEYEEANLTESEAYNLFHLTNESEIYASFIGIKKVLEKKNHYRDIKSWCELYLPSLEFQTYFQNAENAIKSLRDKIEKNSIVNPNTDNGCLIDSMHKSWESLLAAFDRIGVLTLDSRWNISSATGLVPVRALINKEFHVSEDLTLDLDFQKRTESLIISAHSHGINLEVEKVLLDGKELRLNYDGQRVFVRLSESLSDGMMYVRCEQGREALFRINVGV